MNLSSNTEKTLDQWLASPTWHTARHADINRWYDFVNQYQRDHGPTLDETALFEHIAKKVGIVEDAMLDTIRDRISVAYLMFDFLKHTGR